MKETSFVLKNFAGIDLTLEELDFVFADINFNNSQFNFEQEDTEAVFSHAVLLTKTERRRRMTKCICKLF